MSLQSPFALTEKKKKKKKFPAGNNTENTKSGLLKVISEQAL